VFSGQQGAGYTGKGRRDPPLEARVGHPKNEPRRHLQIRRPPSLAAETNVFACGGLVMTFCPE